MNFFFVRDHKGRYRYFSSEPPKPAEVKFSRAKEAWELARKKLMLLPRRTLCMEQAFERALRMKGAPLRIHHASGAKENDVRGRFAAFAQRQRTRHVVVLMAEAVVLPFTGFVAILPGPNIVFYALALLMITQWLALRGIGRTLRADHEFVADARLAAWERAVEAGDEARYPELLEAIEGAHGVREVRRILWPR